MHKQNTMEMHLTKFSVARLSFFMFPLSLLPPAPALSSDHHFSTCISRRGRKMQQKFLFGCNIIFYSKRTRIWKKICLDAAQKKKAGRRRKKEGKEEQGRAKTKDRDSCKVGIEKQTKWLVPCHVF